MPFQDNQWPQFFSQPPLYVYSGKTQLGSSCYDTMEAVSRPRCTKLQYYGSLKTVILSTKPEYLTQPQGDSLHGYHEKLRVWYLLDSVLSSGCALMRPTNGLATLQEQQQNG